MKTQRNQALCSSRLSASLSAFLMCTGATAAEANSGADHHVMVRTAADVRAHRQELREQRRELMLENRASRVSRSDAPAVPTSLTTGLGAQDLKNALHNIRNNTAVLFPGQVSTFRTSRPNKNDGSTYINDVGRTRALAHGVSLDLTSTAANITVGQNLLTGSTTIEVGGHTRVISAGSRVTAAEYAALSQKLATGSQSLTLTSNGAAEGGSLNLNLVSDDGITIRASELVIPKNVTVSGDFARTADGVRITRDVVNYGSLLATSTNTNRNIAVIAARDINNEQGGIIASQATISNPQLDLALRADRDLSNLGTISSAGSLELSAGRSINNSSSNSVAQAQGAVLVNASQINNNGVISSANSSITLTAAADANLTVNNYGGVLSAQNGAINIRNADYTGASDSIVYGGNLLSKEVNINAGQATGDIVANEITGMINTSGAAAHVSANTSDLVLGAQCLTGDPTFYNTGNIILGGDINVGEELAIISGGDIKSTLSSLTINTHAGGAQGFNIHIIAGANITAGSGEIGGTGTLPAENIGNITKNATAPVTISGASAAGGDVDLTGITSSLTITASSTSGNLNSGNVTIAAFASAGGAKGHVLTNTGNNHQIFANGIGTGKNGNVTVIAGAKSGTAIQIGKIINNIGTGAGGGDITLVNAQPISSDGKPITFSTTGSITSGNSLIGSSTTGGGAVNVGVMVTTKNVTIISGGTTVMGDIAGTGGQLVKVNSVGDLTVNDINQSMQKSLLLSQGDITIKSRIRTDGGIMLVAGGDIISADGGSGFPELLSTPTGNAGNISVVAGAAFQVNANDVTITGASGTGGSIIFDQGANNDQIQNLRASSTGGNGNGGDVNLIAFGGAGTGKIHLPTVFALDVGSNGNGTGANGDINIIAGANSADAITMGGADARGGNTDNTGSIYISSAAPLGSVALSTNANFAGISAGTFQGGTISPLGGVTIGRTLQSSASTVTINSGAGGATFGDISLFKDFQVNSLGDILCTAGAISSGNTAVVSGAGGGQNTLLWTALGDISFCTRIIMQATGGGTTYVGGGGGITMVAGGNIQTINNPLGGFENASLETSSFEDGGNITVIAGAKFTRTGNSLNITGDAGTGGSILFDGTAVGFTGKKITHVDAHSLGGSNQLYLDGGSITLISYNDVRVEPSNTNFFSAGGGSFNVPPPVFGVNGVVTVVGEGAIVLPKIDMTNNQGGSITIRAATPSLASIDVTPNTLQSFGVVNSGSFTTGSLSTTPLAFSTVFNGAAGSVGYSVASVGDITLGAIDVSSSRANVSGGTVSIQSGGKVSLGAISANNTAASGNGGSITVISNSATILDIGGGGTNGTGNLSANASATIGDGGEIHIANLGSGGVKITTLPSATVTNGNGATLELNAGTGALDITPIGATINRSGVGTNKKGGEIDLTYGTLIGAAGVITLTANGTGTGGGGTVSVQTTAAGAAGNITIGNAAGQFVASTTGGGGSISFNAGGALTLAATGDLNSADNVNLRAAGAVLLSKAITSKDVRVSAGGTLTVNGAITADPITLLSVGDMAINADQVADGGILIVSGGNITTTTTLDIDGHSTTGNGGNVVIIAGANFTETANDVKINGASATGGSIDFTTGGSLSQITSNTTNAGSSGGDITLLAFQGSAAGAIKLSPAAPINAGGGAGGSNGDVTILAMQNTGTGISAGNIDSKSGAVGTGSISIAATTPAVATASAILKSNASYTGTFYDGNSQRGGSVSVGNLGTAYGDVSVTGGGNITVGTISGVNGAGTAAGADVKVTSGSTGALTVGAITASGIGTGNGGAVNIFAGSGALSLSTITSNGGSTGAGGAGGVVTVSASTASSLNLSAIQAKGNGTSGDGGTIDVTNRGTGGITITNANYDVGAAGDGGHLDFDAGSGALITAAGPLVLNANAGGASFNNGTIDITANNVATSGDITLQAKNGLAGTGAINLFLNAGIFTGGGNFVADSGGGIALNLSGNNLSTAGAAKGGDVTLLAGLNISGGAKIITTPSGANLAGGAVNVQAGALGSVTLNTVTTSGNGTGNGGAISIKAGTGGLTTNALTTTGTLSGAISLQSTDSNITVSGIVKSSGTTGDLTVNLLGATPGNATFVAGNTVAGLNASGGGKITFDNGNTALKLNSLGGAQSLVASTTDSAVGVSITNNLTTTGTIVFNTPKFTNTKVISAASVTVQNLSGSLTVDGGAGGTITATTPAAGPAGSPSNPAAIIFSTSANLNLNGLMTFNGDVLLSAPGGTTTSANGSLYQGNNNVTLATNTWTQLGTGNITGKNFILAGLTLINATGDFVLGSDAIYLGRDLAIIAQKSIILGSNKIDISNAAGNGGNLTMLAGYNFTGSGVYTLVGSSGFAGSITGTGLITTGSTSAGGNAGDIVIVANGGSVSLGAITSTSTSGAGGDINIIASNGISTGLMNTTGSTSSGDVLASVSNPIAVGLPGPITVTNGIVSGGEFAPGSLTSGPLTVAGVTTGNGSIVFETHGAITVNGPLTGNTIILSTEKQGAITLANDITATAIAGQGGLISLTGSTITKTGGGPLGLTASGTTSGGDIAVRSAASIAAGNTSPSFVIDASSSAGGGGGIELTSDADLVVGGASINANGPNGNGANFSFTAGNSLTLNDVAFLSQANATGTNSNGGSVVLDANIMQFTSTSAAPLVLSANGKGTGSGGTVTYRNQDTTQTYIGTPAKAIKGLVNFVALSAQSGASGGNGGILNVDVGGNLTVDPTAAKAGPLGANGNGAQYSFSTTNVSGKAGNLVILGNLDASGKGAGIDGAVTLHSDNTKAFTIGGTKAPKNGILGSVTGNLVNISNGLGGITLNATSAINAADLTLSAGGKGAIAEAKGATITSTNLLTLSSEAGSIGKKALLVSAPNLTVNANSGGGANITDTFAGAVTLSNTSATSGNFVLTTTGGLNVGSFSTTNGDITMTAGGGTLQVAAGKTIEAKNGKIVLSNSNIASGDISIGAGATVKTSGQGGTVVIAIGAVPKKGVSTTAPSGVTVTEVGKGKAYFDPTGGVVATGTVAVNAINKSVIFGNKSTGGKVINLGTGVLVEADPPSRIANHTDFAIVDNTTPLMSSSADDANSSIALGTFNSMGSTSTTISNFDVSQFGLTDANILNAQSMVTNTMLGEASTVSGTTLSASQSNSAMTGEASDLTIDAVLESDREVGQKEFAGGRVSASRETNSASKGGARQSIKNHHVLSQGNVVFAPFTDTEIETSHGSVKLAAGAIALIMQSNDGLAVYDLHDQGKNDIVVTANSRQMSLSPGRHVQISSHSASDFASVNPIELVQYRGLKQSKLDNGWSIYTSEFSIPSACYAVKPLKQLMTSKHREATNLAKRILKTTAVLFTLSPDRGDYVQFFRRQMTAMSK